MANTLHCYMYTSYIALLLHHTLHCYYIILCTATTSYIALMLHHTLHCCYIILCTALLCHTRHIIGVIKSQRYTIYVGRGQNMANPTITLISIWISDDHRIMIRISKGQLSYISIQRNKKKHLIYVIVQLLIWKKNKQCR